MALDPRTPVIVGAGQFTQRVDQGDPVLEPVDMMVEALRTAERESGGRGVLAAARSVRCIRLASWRYGDAAALVGERVGATPTETVFTHNGGQLVGTVVAQTTSDILAGSLDVALLVGGEAWKTHLAAQASGEELKWTRQPEGTAPSVIIGDPSDFRHPAEDAVGAVMPVQIYPVLENAMRAVAGRTLEEHRVHLGRVWAPFSEVARHNPYAWDRRGYSADEIVSPSPGNRMVAFPYTKLMMSNERVDQAAAIIMCSVEKARSLGVAEDRWVFPWASSHASAPKVSERSELGTSPMLEACGRALWDAAGVGPDDVAHADLYSCFPSAVQAQALEFGLGLDSDRRLTVTGGMRFSGGPWNNYAMHGLAGMVTELRDDPGSIGLCTANGGYITKQSALLYSTTPPPKRFRSVSPQAELDAMPRRAFDLEPRGVATVESYTVMHGRSEPEKGIVACRMPDGRRAWGTVTDPITLKAMETEEIIGRTATFTGATPTSLEMA